MAQSSVNSTATWNSVASTELRSISFQGDGRSIIEASCIGDDFSSAVVGQNQQVTITIVTLDEPSGWDKPALGDQGGDAHTLVLSMGDGGGGGSPTPFTRAFYRCVIQDCSIDVGLDAVVEFTWTFVTIGDPVTAP